MKTSCTKFWACSKIMYHTVPCWPGMISECNVMRCAWSKIPSTMLYRSDIILHLTFSQPTPDMMFAHFGFVESLPQYWRFDKVGRQGAMNECINKLSVSINCRSDSLLGDNTCLWEGNILCIGSGCSRWFQQPNNCIHPICNTITRWQRRDCLNEMARPSPTENMCYAEGGIGGLWTKRNWLERSEA